MSDETEACATDEEKAVALITSLVAFNDKLSLVAHGSTIIDLLVKATKDQYGVDARPADVLPETEVA